MWRHTASFGSGMKTASAAPFWHLPVPGGTARWRMQAVWWLVWPKLFGPGARAIVEGWTPSGHTRLLSPSRLTMAPGYCMYSQQSGQQSATLLRIRALPVRGRQAVLTAVVCFGPCASEGWGFAYILRPGSNFLSSCNLTLPLVAACSCACSYAPSPRASQDNAIEYEGYERPA